MKDEVRVSPNEMLELNLLKGQYFIELTLNRFRTVKKIVILE